MYTAISYGQVQTILSAAPDQATTNILNVAISRYEY